MITPETLNYVPEITYVIGTLYLLLAFTKAQRDSIAFDRDGGHCQATVSHKCNEKYGLEVDHIIPQRYAAQLGLDPDFPENALTKCKNAHNIKHPDRALIMKHYYEDKQKGINSFKLLFEQRAEKLAHREIYWNAANDRTDTVRAIQLTQKAKVRGWVFPEHTRRST